MATCIASSVIGSSDRWQYIVEGQWLLGKQSDVHVCASPYRSRGSHNKKQSIHESKEGQ